MTDTLQEAGINRSQKKFCKMARTRNIRLLAPAGSGKTFSLLCRCRFITDECEKKESPQPRFLILTFTRAARFELEDRMKKNPAFAGIHATVRTLNSWGWEQYRRAGKTLVVSNKDRKDLVTQRGLKGMHMFRFYPGRIRCRHLKRFLIRSIN